MGCFFGCFRVRDERCPPIHIVSQPINSAPKEPVGSLARNRLSSLFHFEEERDDSPSKEEKYGVTGSSAAEIDSNELKAEAKFLKACGTLPRTPDEIRNTKKLKDSQLNNGVTDSSKFHSWLPSTTPEKIKFKKQNDQLHTPMKLDEEWHGSDSSSHSPNSCITGQNTGKISSSSEGCVSGHAEKAHDLTDSATPPVTSLQGKHKSVRFDCQSDASSYSSRSSSSGLTNQISKKYGLLPGDYSVSKPSPYPTPLKLTDDMQTPGTVFPAYFHNNDTGKSPRIRSQYVYPVLNPIENFSQLKALSEEGFSSDHGSGQLEEYIEQNDNDTPESQENLRAKVADKELNVDASLSSWLPPKAANQGRNDHSVPGFGRTPGDRPILGMVAAHWNADEASSISPKWWDGNGIPNSTNKYKEDQKVSWHATPFEERLEKALSEDKLFAERKQHGHTPPLNLDEKEERDTAGSDLQLSSHFESGSILMNKA